MKFWLKAREDYYRRPPVTEAELEEAEKELGHKLPETYRKLLLEQNGGSIRFNALRLRKRPIDGNFFVEFDHLRGVGEWPGILDTAYMTEEWNLPKGLVLLNGDGHTWFALDYRNNRFEPAVSYIDTEGDLDFVLADNFDEFIKDLYIQEEGLYFFNPDEEEDYKLDAMPEDELISLLQSGHFTKIIKALDNLFYYPKNSITENYVLNLLNETKEKVQDKIGSTLFQYISFQRIKYDLPIVNKIIDELKKHPNVAHYSTLISEFIKEMEEAKEEQIFDDDEWEEVPYEDE